ncbi:MAG: hypothetical protein AAGA54_09850 [Myxococcota bacterium]
MLVRLGLAKQGRVTTVPTVAVMIALLGYTGLAAGLGALAMMAARGQLQNPGEVAPVLVLFAFFGFMSVMMSVSGTLGARSGRVIIERAGETLSWRYGEKQGSMPAASARVSVQQRGMAKYRHYEVVLLGASGTEPLQLGASVLESLAQARSRRFARSLGLAD